MKELMKHRISALAVAAMLGAGMIGAVSPIAAVPAFAEAASEGYVDLVEQVAPAVVYIEVTQRADVAQLPDTAPIEEFMRRFGMPAPMPGIPGQIGREIRGVGTGFIISPDGQIVTNAHVVDGADEVKVTLGDGRSFQARIVGADPATDIALLRIDAGEELPTVRFGNSDELKVGQPVVAIGNPFGLGNSVTAGIVSALGRDINSGPFDNYIQTDAAINKGNSGGPLFNTRGEVVGINTAIFSPSGGSVGIGFAVPAETAKKVVADLADDGMVERGWLGVQIQPVTEDIAAALGFDRPKGVLIANVDRDTPADKAGIMRGDIVMAVDGEKVDSPRDLTRAIATSAPGSKVRIELLRAGVEKTVEVTLGKRPEQAS
ncbi:serine protease Do [Albidovulum inexpectatum]|uniref:Serine protease Do n=1 Tax=Albidovulum inexpectatum TaxID=196587 RepID=A0A2S5JJ52_9RHOB|nr:Do family serine endopeptidase [Albidovulum inexpectatum]PPB81483.1 serine protease Do [Albidovulum inexpectatum]